MDQIDLICILGIGTLVPIALLWLVFFPPTGKTVFRIKAAEGKVALTFDDGPHPVHTRELLRGLEEHGNIKATFFMTGKHVKAYPDIVREVARAGHEIANHGFDETVLAFKSRAFIEESVRKTDEALEIALGKNFKKSPYFRAAKGLQFLTVARVLKAQGRIHVGAFILGNDWEPNYQGNPASIAEMVLKKVGEGEVIALHDGDDRVTDAADADRSGTVKAVKLILDGLEERGLKAVTVGELLSSPGGGS